VAGSDLASATRSQSADAAAAATEFLVGHRSADGWWRDFDTLAGPSDEWVTAYVATALVCSRHAGALAAADEAWRLLVRRRPLSGGRGYNRAVPADGDSTAFFAQLAYVLGHERSLAARRAERFLARRCLPSGGMTTFASATAIRRYTRLARNERFRGWCRDHVCVTAAAAALPSFNSRPEIRGYLRRAQGEDGAWTAYWWCDREYASALAAEALARNPSAADRHALDAALMWAERRAGAALLADGVAPFAGAYLLRLLALDSEDKTRRYLREALTDRLLDRQRADGSWQASARLRIPPPDVVDPEAYDNWVVGGRGGGSVQQDKGVFTTAAVLAALAASRADG